MPGRKVAPQQYKQPSRKGKKAWRKNVDVSDVQSGLEQLREEIRQGGPVAERPSEELFALDAIGSESIQRAYNKTHKPLKVDEILAQRSAVPAVDSRKRSSDKIFDGIVPVAKRQKKDWVSKKDVKRLKESIKGGAVIPTGEADVEESAQFDLWDQPAVVTQRDVQPGLPPQRSTKVPPPTLRQAPIAMTASGKPVRSVQTPKESASYNPLFEAWDQSLTEEAKREVEKYEKQRREEVAEAERTARLAAVTAAIDDAARRTDDESAWEGFESGYDSAGALKKKRPERKTQAQRNKIKRRKGAEREAKHAKQMAERRTRDAHANEENEQLETDDVEAAVLRTEMTSESESGDDATLRRRRIGNILIPEKRLEIVLPDELQDSLRRLKPEGNLLNDRFRNLLVNGKLEARKPITHPKRVKRKLTEKWSYKDFSIEV